MNESPLISDDWVAIRDFSIFSANKNISSSDDIEVTWNDDKHFINIHYKVRETDNENNNSNTHQGNDSLKWKHSVLYTVEALIGTHRLLENLIPEFNVMLPEMPLQQKGFWGYLLSSVVPENFESNLTEYLKNIKSKLGEKYFLEQYFEVPSDEDHLEDLNELNRAALLEELHSAKELLDEVHILRPTSINLLDTLSIYALEDEAQMKIDLAEATLYNFERQPFIELREVAREKYRNAQKKLQEQCDEDEKLKISQSCLKWQNELKDNEICLNDLQLNYFEKCMANLTRSCDMMVEDNVKYGVEFQQSAGARRLSKKKIELYQLNLQLLQLRKKKLIIKRENAKTEVCQLCDGEHLEKELQALERKFYKAQMNIFDLQMKILSEEESLYRMQLLEFLQDHPDITTYHNGLPQSDLNDDVKKECEIEPVNRIDEIEKDDVKQYHKEQYDKEKKKDYDDDDDDEENFHDCVEEHEVQNKYLEESDIINQFVAALPTQSIAYTISSSQEEIESNVDEPDSDKRNIPLNDMEWKRKQELTTMLNRVFRKRAWLRNKQRKFTGVWKEKINVRKEAEELYKKHHAVHLKRRESKAAMEIKKEFLQAERRKTIQRLKAYRTKNPDEPVRVPARYALPIRRTRNLMTKVPFRPGGPSVVLPGSNMSLRFMSDAEVNKQKIKATTRNSDEKVNNKRKSSLKLVADESDTPLLSPLPPPSIPTPTIPPPPPPLLPPPPVPPLLPPPPSLTEHQSKNQTNKKESVFPIPPKRENLALSPKQQNTTLDLSSIINARTKLKKTTPNTSDNRLSDVTANMLMNALNKMKKYTSDSTDDEDEEDSSFD
ncbi:junction-mediating and -regulatory protein-like isoform X2 [Hydractinia symbiolongicarpus]|nr:junction-mediating and -regulatory protein-like isoform X2 [Hydractinia symbiolongicarpus]